MEEINIKINNQTGSRDENKLFEEFAAGDKQAFSEIMKKYRNKSLNFAYRYLGDFDEAEDAAQDCFVKIYFNCRRFDPSRPFDPWFFSILTNCCRDRLRHRNRFTRFIERLRSVAGIEGSPEDIYREDNSYILNKAIQKLSPSIREIIAFRFSQDLSYQEIAETLKISQGTVMSRLFRAKRDLEKILMGMGVVR